MDLKGKHVILGSNSPRRRELLAGLNIDFEVDTKNDFDEHFSPDTPYDEVPRLMSVGKSHGFHRPLADNEILITADTMVILPPTEGRPGEILGKPRDREDAIRMLRDLSGREHHVTTAVTIRTATTEETFTDTTEVWFKDLTDEKKSPIMSIPAGPSTRPGPTPSRSGSAMPASPGSTGPISMSSVSRSRKYTKPCLNCCRNACQSNQTPFLR